MTDTIPTGTLATSWELPSIDPIELCTSLGPEMDNWFYERASLDEVTFTLFTDSGERFHRQPEYRSLLSVVEGTPNAITGARRPLLGAGR